MDQGEEGTWEYSQKSWVGLCGHFHPQNPIYDQFDILFMTVVAGTVVLSITYDGL